MAPKNWSTLLSANAFLVMKHLFQILCQTWAVKKSPVADQVNIHAIWSTRMYIRWQNQVLLNIQEIPMRPWLVSFIVVDWSEPVPICSLEARWLVKFKTYNNSKIVFFMKHLKLCTSSLFFLLARFHVCWCWTISASAKRFILWKVLKQLRTNQNMWSTCKVKCYCICQNCFCFWKSTFVQSQQFKKRKYFLFLVIFSSGEIETAFRLCADAMFSFLLSQMSWNIHEHFYHALNM